MSRRSHPVGRLRRAVASDACEALEPRRLLSQISLSVTNTNDSGAGSFRHAIDDANAAAPADAAAIEFNIAGSGVHTIKLLSPLPFITGEVDIIGQTDSSGNPQTELDGQNAGAFADGLFFERNTPGNTQDSVINGLIINRFGSSGIDIQGGNTQVYGCWIGINNTGTKASPNGQEGILDESQHNQIGLNVAGARYQNVISGNKTNGITVTAADNTIENCLIGTNAAGTAAVGNQGWGVILGAGHDDIGVAGGKHSGCVISGNVSGGVEITANSGGVFNSKIGTNAGGTAAVPNEGPGVEITGSDVSQIGDETSNSPNLISGNLAAGIVIQDSPNALVIDNMIGTNAAGTAAIGNTGPGISVDGLDDSIFANLISGNGSDGIVVEKEVSTTANVDIERNKIGTDVTGTKSVSNHGDGIQLNNTPNGQVGGTLSTSANIIAFNAKTGADGFGVDVLGAKATDNLILGNSIFSNGRLGINLGDNGGKPLANDSGDADVGPNDLQNYPVQSSAVLTGSTLAVTGSLDSTAKTNFRVEFFASPSADPSGYGQGKTFLGFAAEMTNPAGKSDFVVDLPPAPVGDVITATATYVFAGDPVETSEFSKAIKLTGSPGAISGLVFDDTNGDGVHNTGEAGLGNWKLFIDSNDNGKLDSGEPTALTNSSGKFKFSNLVAGKTYVVREVLQSSWRQTAPSGATASIVVGGGATEKAPDFGDTQKASAGAVFATTDLGQCAWTAYADINKDAILDAGDISILS